MNKNTQFENDKYLKSLVKQSIIYTMKITVYMSNGSVETPLSNTFLLGWK